MLSIGNPLFKDVSMCSGCSRRDSTVSESEFEGALADLELEVVLHGLTWENQAGSARSFLSKVRNLG